MKKKTYLRALSVMALASAALVTAAVAQDGPVRADAQVHFSIQRVAVEPRDLSLARLSHDAPIGSTDLLQVGSIEDDFSNSILVGELVGHTVNKMNSLLTVATGWVRQSETVQPMFFVQNRLANVESRRTVEHLEPALKGQNRVYCVGLRFSF